MEEDTVVRLPRTGGSVEDDPLLEVLRSGARRMLQQAVEAEVETFLAAHAELEDDRGRRRVVRNGHAPEREILHYAEISRAPTCLAVVRYEDFLADFAGWLATLERALELPPDPRRRARLAPLAPQRPAGERRNVKVRAAKAGQFRERLAPATVAALDREFASILERFGYAEAAAKTATAG
jgi:hypothetical protein